MKENIIDDFLGKLDMVFETQKEFLIPGYYVDLILDTIKNNDINPPEIDEYNLMRNIKGIIINKDLENPFFTMYKIKFDIMERNFIISPYYDEKDIKKEETNNMLKILKIYEEKKTKEIEEKYDKQLKELEENDPVTIYKKQSEETLKEILDTEELEIIINSDVCEFTKETMDKKKETINTIHNKKRELETQISEIEALLELAPNYEEKIQILKDYGIIDKEKNIVL